MQIGATFQEDNLAQVLGALKVLLSFEQVIAHLGIQAKEAKMYACKGVSSKSVMEALEIGKRPIQRPGKLAKLAK